MSANNQLIILKNEKGEFEIHMNICVDSNIEQSDLKSEKPLAKTTTLHDAIKFANKYCQENIVEYGYTIFDSALIPEEKQ